MKLKLSEVIITLFFCGYFLYLFAQNKIGYYINPKYYYWTLTALVLSTVFAAISLYFIVKDYSKLRKYSTASYLVSVVLSIGLFVSLFVVPIKPLTSNAIAFSTTPRIFSSSDKSSTKQTLLSTSTVSNLTIKDWLIAFKSASKPQSFEGQKVKLTGFVSKPDSGNNTYQIGRFQVSCCLADAQFYFIPVTTNTLPNQDKWGEIEGVFKIVDNKLTIEQQSFNTIATPENPYF
jgi:uncharacterized repeat protein (TIGR03943 family)